MPWLPEQTLQCREQGFCCLSRSAPDTTDNRSRVAVSRTVGPQFGRKCGDLFSLIKRTFPALHHSSRFKICLYYRQFPKLQMQTNTHTPLFLLYIFCSGELLKCGNPLVRAPLSWSEVWDKPGFELWRPEGRQMPQRSDLVTFNLRTVPTAVAGRSFAKTANGLPGHLHSQTFACVQSACKS